MSNILLQTEHLTKGYRMGHVAMHDVSFSIQKGHIHGLLGENGAGRTTLIRLLTGALRADFGTISLDGAPFNPKSPAQAAKMGVITMEKHLGLVPGLTVAENIMLGDKTSGLFLDKQAAVETTRALTERFGIELDPYALAAHLTEEDALETELLKAVKNNVKLLILDEPATYISMGQIEYLFQMLRRFAQAGITVLYVTNQPSEALHVCDEITVVRDGSVVETLSAEQATEAKLKLMMSTAALRTRPIRKEAKVGQTVMQITDLSTFRQAGQPALEDLDLKVRAGEILAVVGNADSGVRQLCDVIAGHGRILGGKITLFDEDITHDGMAGTRDLGVSFLVSDAEDLPVARYLSIQENLLANQYENPAYMKDGFLDSEKLYDRARRLVKEYQIECEDVGDMVETLSAASIQKLMVARECSSEPVLLVAYRPTENTSGVTTSFLRRKLIELRDEGTAILLVPTDMEEYEQMADRTVVLHNGRMTACSAGQMEPELLDAYTTGAAEMTMEEMEALLP